MTRILEYYDGTSWNSLSFNAYRLERVLNSYDFLTVNLPFEQSGGVNTRSLLGSNVEMRLRESSIPVTMFGGYARSKGKFNEDGSISVKVYGYGERISGNNVTLDLQNTDNKAVFTAIMSGTQYTSVIPTGTPTYSISRFKVDMTRRQALQEVTGNLDYVIVHEPNKEVFYEPKGYRNSGTTFTHGTNGVGVLEYEDDIRDGYYNKVEVVSANTGSGVVGTASNIPAGDEEKLRRFRVDWATTQSELDTVAQEMIEDNKRISAKVRSPERFTRFVNEQVTLNYARIGVTNQDLIVVKQVDTYPERTTTFTLGYSEEEDGAGRISRQESEIRQRRNEIIRGGSGVEVGQQSITTTTGTGFADTVSSENDESPNVNGVTDVPSRDFDFSYDRDTKTFQDGENDSFNLNLNFVTGNAEFALITVHIEVLNPNSTGSGYDLDVRNDDTNETLMTANDICDGYRTWVASTINTGNVEGDEIVVELSNTSGVTSVVVCHMSGTVIQEHTHSSGSLDAQLHNHNVSTSDGGHDDHDVNATTGSQTINTAELDNIER